MRISRRKRRTDEEKENDLKEKKIFDMTLKLKGLSLVLPENGVAAHT